MTDFWSCPYCDYVKDKSIGNWGEMAADHLCDKHPLTQGIGAKEKPQHKYDSTLARMAGNIAAGLAPFYHDRHDSDSDWKMEVRRDSLDLARGIIADIKELEKESDILILKSKLDVTLDAATRDAQQAFDRLWPVGVIWSHSWELPKNLKQYGTWELYGQGWRRVK